MPIMKPAKMAAATYLRYLFTKTEKALIDEILRKSAEKASVVANETLSQVRRAVGIE